ncbi:MAG: substrate-binding domain-containing protein [Acidobacteriota bacterium]|nr:substrate-binding domain-containing protein [Acidobacteriota bacterium]
MAVTIRDVGESAGVSQATAARVLGGYGHSSAAVRARVEAAAERLGYVPNSIARALASGLTHAVGLVVGDIENPFFAAAARGMSDVLEEHGHTLLLANSDEDLDRERTAVEALRARQVDALVVVPSAAGAFPHLRAAAAAAPLVLLDRAVRGLGVDAVTADNRGGARTAVEHLIEHGHRRIGLISDDPTISTSAERIDGYRDALTAVGITADEHLISLGGATRDDGYRATRRLLESADRPTALFTANNFMTLGAMLALADLGLHVPDDISLVGFDDLEWTTLVDPPLTVVAQPTTELGAVAARRVLARLGGDGGRPRRFKLETRLIARGSCASVK